MMPKRMLQLGSLIALISFGASCTTTTDRYGRQQQTLTPEGAVLGAAAVGLIGYSIAKNKHKDHDHRRYRRGHRDGYYRDPYYGGRRGGYGRGGYCPY